MIFTDLRQALLDAYNKANNVNPPIRLSDVSWASPQLFLQGQCNAKVTIRALPTSDRFTGEKVIHYTRVRLDHRMTGMVVPGKASDYTTTRNVVEKLQTVYGFPLYPEEVFDTLIVSGATTVTLHPRGDSLGYVQTVQATLPFETT